MAKTVSATPAIKVETWPIGRVRGYHRNARDHSSWQIDQIATSIREFGWTTPLLVTSDGGLIAGHGRLEAAQRLGITEVPVVVLAGLSESQQRLLRIADNKLALNASWNLDLLTTELKELRAEGVDLAVTGFDADELADLFGPMDEGMLDTEPALPPAVPYTQRGDLWLLGPHRLLCGDATEQAAWDTVLAARSLDCLWTDPPYGVNYVGGTKDALTITNDDLTPADLERLLRLAFACALTHSASGAPWYVTGPSGPTAIAFGHVLRDLEVWHQTLAWVKDRFVIGRSDYQPRHEQIFYGWTPGGRHVWLGGRRRDSILGEEDGRPVIVKEEGRILVKIGQTTFAITGVELAVQEVETSVIEAERPRRSREHPTMKPPRLIARCLLNSTRRGNLVGDCFAGSGSTLVAAEATGREAACLEIDPRYCDVIVNRYLTATDGEAVNERTGETIRSRLEVAA